MHKTRIPSPARSQGALRTPRRYKLRASRSVCSPTRSSPPRISLVIQQFKENNIESFVVSPLKRRQSVLSNNTDIQQPQRKSWWKNLNDNSRDVIELLDKNKIVENVNNVEELIDYEVLSQEKKDYTWELPESSDCESIHSIVLPQRKLFTLKESQPQSKFRQFIGTHESLAKLHKTDFEAENSTINVRSKNVFAQALKERTRPAFPSALLNLSPNKTANKTKELQITEVQSQVRGLFGNRPVNKPNNMFANFISSGSEDEFSEVQSRPFGFQKKIEQKHRGSTASRGPGDTSPTFSVANDIEIDDWKLLPSSTMVGNQLEDMGDSTPIKRSRLSKLTNIDMSLESEAIFNNNINKTKQSNKSVSSKNRSKTCLRSKDNLENNTSQQSNRSRSSKNKSKTSSNSLLKLNKDKQEQNYSQTKNESKNTSHKINENKDQMKTIHKDTNQILSKHNVDVNEEKNRDQNLFQEKEPTLQENVDHDFYKSVNEHLKNLEHQTVNEEISMKKKCNQDKKNKTEEIDVDRHIISETCKNNRKSTNNQSKDDKNEYENRAYNIHNYIESNNEQEGILPHNIDNKVGDEMKTSNGDKQKMETSTDKQENLETSYNQETFDTTNKNENKEMEAIIDQSEIEDINDKEGLEDSNKQEEKMESSSDNQDVDATNEEEEMEGSDDQEKMDASGDNSNMDTTNEGVEMDVSGENQQTDAIDDQEGDEIDASLDDQGGNDSEETIENDANDDEGALGSEEELKNDLQKEVTPIEDDNDSYERENDNNQIISKGDESQEEIELSDQEFNQQKTVTTHNTSTKNRQHEMTVKSLEAVLHDVTNKSDYSTAHARNSTMAKSKSIIKHLNLKPSLPPINITAGVCSDESRNSTAEGSGWDSHRTTRKTLRQTFGKDFTPRKSLRALVMEKFAKRQTAVLVKNVEPKIHEKTVEPSKTKEIEETDESSESMPQDNNNFSEIKSSQITINEIHIETFRFPQANSTEITQNTNTNLEESENVLYSASEYEYTVESSTHVQEMSLKTRQTTLEMFLRKINRDNMERRRKIEDEIKSSLKTPKKDILNNFKVPTIIPKGKKRPNLKTAQNKRTQIKSSLIPLDDLPKEFVEDMKYKPPKRFRPTSASWITKRLYKFLETKLEPKYDYKTRVRAEILVENIYAFTKLVRRNQIAPSDAVVDLKREMARLGIVKTHFDFNQFFHYFMPREIRIKVIPDAINNIPLPRQGIYADILESSEEY